MALKFAAERLTVFTKQLVKHLANHPTKAQEAQRQVLVIHLKATSSYLLLRQQDRNYKLLSSLYPQYTFVVPVGVFQPYEHILVRITSV